MSEHSKPAWPKTPDGTTDWDVVFEDPKTGLIPIISEAQSRQALRQCTCVVIQQLFTRKDDADDVAKFTAQLDDILAGVNDAEELNATIASVMALLRRIKEERLEKARLYVAQKNARQRAQERRAQKEYKAQRTATLMSFLLRISQPKIAIGLFAILIALAGGIYFAVGLFETPPTPDQSPVASGSAATSADDRRQAAGQDGGQTATGAAKTPPTDGTANDGTAQASGQNGPGATQTQPATPGQAATDAPLANVPPAPGGAKALPAKPTLPRIIVLRPFSWPPFDAAAVRQTTTYYAALIYPIKNSTATSAICRRYPQVVDAVYLAFNALATGEDKIDGAALAKISAMATTTINTEVGAPYVAKTELIRYGDPQFRTSNRHKCRLIRRPIPPVPKPPVPATPPAKTDAATPPKG
ncbi:hypothetical protein EDD55_10244 [Varunaivibrio sulfuroxidans]|uniref:Uncharacterized protein n=1 Tax=Varunaivibrio sulfuroxidans TaxID=1773489 RepID=A0A4R3JE19_9PROT|nr:hypothetical protein [Varunaivibrio sulfuroxidans]TCS64007.1 hypothetical protein EDD55_10244 [Varunaivibrio sulfuroxidans]